MATSSKKLVIECADEVRIDEGEDGYWLAVDTTTGTYQFYIHHLAAELLNTVEKTIGVWSQEGEAARSVHPGQITVEDLDAYPLGDYKRLTLEREME